MGSMAQWRRWNPVQIRYVRLYWLHLDEVEQERKKRLMLLLVAIRYLRSDSISADMESSKNKEPDLLEMLMRTRHFESLHI